ncbi:MAG: 4Fe-4S dicluster domain-containing protein [Bacteroidetes bacterium]|nr:4Fe-4S dicluster domain-containing protein [Bacteroidota bacterium]
MSNSTFSSKKRFWKTSEEFLLSPNELQNEQQEFSADYDKPPVFESAVSRRTFMALLSATMAVGAAACRRPDHKLVPTVKAVEYRTPGIPNYYTTVYQNRNAAFGLLVKTVEGRPIKLDGNDRHPISMGVSSSRIQATLLSLYDPDRVLRRPRLHGGDSSVTNGIITISDAIKSAIADGKTVRILIDEHCSPSYTALINEIELKIPSLKFVTVPATISDGTASANNSILGIDSEIVPDLSKADVIVSVDADLLGTDKNSVYHIRNFSAKRKPTKKNPVMNMLFTVEAMMSLTGANSDHRIIVQPSEYEQILSAILKEVIASKGSSSVGANVASAVSSATHPSASKIAEMLTKAGDKGIVVAGAHLSTKANAIALCINLVLGSVGTGKVLDIAHTLPNSNRKTPAIENLRSELKSKSVGVLIFADTNTEYFGDRDMKSLVSGVPKRISLSQYEDETCSICSVIMPTTHFLESWGDAVGFEGTYSIQQPIIAPLNESSISIQDALIQISKALNPELFTTAATYFDYIRTRLQSILPNQKEWDNSLQDGIVKNASIPQVGSLNVNQAGAAELVSKASKATMSKTIGHIALSLTVNNGDLANNGWLQELPDPITKVTWGNIAAVSAKTAGEWGVKQGDVIRISTNNGSIEVPTFIQDGMADGVVSITTGYGRTQGGTILKNVGANVYKLLGLGESLGYIEITVEKTGKHEIIATTQGHNSIEGRDIVRDVTLAEFVSDNHEHEHHLISNDLSIVDDYTYKGHRWGMTIDMSACVGCSACTTACQVENNIPSVGKQEVINGREMHWIRLDRYYSKDDKGNVETLFQPMLCQHCENAPCENVCPVAATTHSPEGLNEMTYNRCVGTRYCLNNCPYKVRRFNFLNWHKNDKTPLDLVFNPDVTVRMRGIMEKCTFCVQRINEGKFHAKDHGRARVLDGEIITACQQACPAGAIIFGDMNDKTSKVYLSKNTEDRKFRVLEELNVRPSITYHGKVRNKAEKA